MSAAYAGRGVARARRSSALVLWRTGTGPVRDRRPVARRRRRWPSARGLAVADHGRVRLALAPGRARARGRRSRCGRGGRLPATASQFLNTMLPGGVARRRAPRRRARSRRRRHRRAACARSAWERIARPGRAGALRRRGASCWRCRRPVAGRPGVVAVLVVVGRLALRWSTPPGRRARHGPAARRACATTCGAGCSARGAWPGVVLRLGGGGGRPRRDVPRRRPRGRGRPRRWRRCCRSPCWSSSPPGCR